MNVVTWKEKRELALGTLVACLCGAVCLVAAKENTDPAITVFASAGTAGLLVGALQGWLDRAALEDAFLLHRPLGGARMEAARVWGGLAAFSLPLAVFLAMALWLPFERGYPIFGGLLREAADPLWDDFSPAIAALALGFGVATWATARLGAGVASPVRAVLLTLSLPALVTLALVRQTSAVGAVTVVLVATVLATGLRMATSAGWRRARVALALSVVCAVCLETAVWARALAFEIHDNTLPGVVLGDDGAPILVTTEAFIEGDGELRTRQVLHDTGGRRLPDSTWAELGPGRVEVPLRPGWSNEDGPIARLDDGAIEESLSTRDWADAVADRLNQRQSGWWTSLAEWMSRRPRPELGRPPFSIWRFEDGRFVCRDAETREALAGLGPDGWRGGADAAAGERWDRGAVTIARRFRGRTRFQDKGGAVLLDESRRRVAFLDLPPDAPQSRESRALRDQHTPVQPDFRTFDAGGTGPVAFLPGWHNSWAGVEDAHDGRPRTFNAVTVRVGDELRRFSLEGLVQTIPLGADERDMAGRVADSFATVLPPIGGSVPRFRVRIVDGRGGHRAVDVSVPPVNLASRVTQVLTGLPTLVRPPVTNLVSFAAPEPHDLSGFFSRWLLDGRVAATSEFGWLAASLAIGAWCAWRLRRRALEQRPEPRSLLAWTIAGMALGPAALVGAAIVMPRGHVVACTCGRRRAVHVANCPACAASWPAPARTGIEVFA